jgi:hypothetical protein
MNLVFYLQFFQISRIFTKNVLVELQNKKFNVLGILKNNLNSVLEIFKNNLNCSWTPQEQKIFFFRNSRRTFPWFACSLPVQEQKSNSDISILFHVNRLWNRKYISDTIRIQFGKSLVDFSIFHVGIRDYDFFFMKISIGLHIASENGYEKENADRSLVQWYDYLKDFFIMSKNLKRI